MPQRRISNCIRANRAQRCVQLALPRLARVAVAAHDASQHVFQRSAATRGNAGLAVAWYWHFKDRLQQIKQQFEKQYDRAAGYGYCWH
jgi:hypothetical protein